ncbi:MAG: Ig-like domain repeat protein, partial [Abitibacteriaceae bacterium]|nr:Ig-like domain repeat protein [Abditibacteriaceae bacterium]
PDGNGDPNDAGAMWEPGETWNDSANNISVSVNEATPTGFTVTITNQTPDLVPPTISLTSPVDGSLVTAMPAIYGTAQDDPLGRGLQQVSVTIQRNSDGLYWNGSTWSGPITDLPTNLFGINGWSLNSVPLPTGANLADGKYTIVATAMDVAGNTASAVATISVDATPPNISMTAPVTGSAQSISIISGTAIDTPAGSGLQRVVVSILRSKDGQYWTGSGWTATPTALPATLNSDSTWVVSSLVLPGSALLDSDYAVTAAAIDYAGNVGVASAKVTVNSGLRIFMNAPINNGAVHDFAVAVGTATENAGNSGIVGVIVSIQRTGDKAYWNGIGWTATPSGVPAVYNSSNGTWSFNSSSALPQGANLLDGPYVFSATAIDRIGNMVTTSVAVTVDATAPQVSIASPANNVYVRKFPVVVGKADDNPGGTGIDHVDLMIKRYDGVYWNGTLWTEAPSVLETLRSNDDWSFTTEASPIAGLSDGQYTLTAIAYDKAGGSSSASRTLVLDSTAPQAPIITTPTNNTFVKRFGTIQGLASDNVSGNGVTRATGVNGSGVSHVDLNIQRRSDGKWWSGGSWSDTPIGIPTSFANGKWTRNSGFPAGSYLSDGQYTITPITYDKAGNRTVGSSTTLTVDETAPNLTFVRPGLNSGAKSVPVVQGTVDDGTGSGVKEVTLSIQRRTDGKYWSGSTWAIKQTQLTTALSGGTWSRRTGLPTGADLPAGNYYFIAQATDKIGNMRRLVSAVSVDTTGPS